MPKVRKPPDRYLALKTLIAGRCEIYGVPLSDVLGCSAPTAKRRLRDPGLFTLGELHTIGAKLDIPIDELRAAIR